MNAPTVQCIELSKAYAKTRAVTGLNITVNQGEILAVVGPSGCGKTTLLRLVAGFEQPDEGQIFLGGRLVADRRNSTPPEQRGVGMVFQEFALFPHLSVAQNVAYGLDGLSRAGKVERVNSMLKLAGLRELADRYPHELSGGERQRVALARALSPQPVMILLDEPFSNLDADRRIQMREEVRAILISAQTTAIFVTHDQEEALFMGDRLAVMQQGCLIQIGSAEEIYHSPQTRFVAEFMGRTDFIPGKTTADGILTEIGLLPQCTDLAAGTRVDVAFRPDDVTIQPRADGKSLILARHFQGAQNLYRVRLPSGRIIHSLQPHTCLIKPGTKVHVSATPGHPLAWFPGEVTAQPLPGRVG